jgi:DDB1- and CUL4-associated factor 6
MKREQRLTLHSWSDSGNLLASGSDDTQISIWQYNPAGSAKPFTLNTSISTGHHANIFSVKFMPHSGDKTIVSCAGDSEVRVFDIEYSDTRPGNSTNSAFASSTRSRRFSDFFPNSRWLNEASTNAKVYRSHGDRAKRIVTESSPHLFLSCSEDGEVSLLSHPRISVQI